MVAHCDCPKQMWVLKKVKPLIMEVKVKLLYHLPLFEIFVAISKTKRIQTKITTPQTGIFQHNYVHFRPYNEPKRSITKSKMAR